MKSNHQLTVLIEVLISPRLLTFFNFHFNFHFIVVILE